MSDLAGDGVGIQISPLKVRTDDDDVDIRLLLATLHSTLYAIKADVKETGVVSVCLPQHPFEIYSELKFL